MTELFNVLTPPAAWARFLEHFRPIPRTERIPTADALGRVLAETAGMRTHSLAPDTFRAPVAEANVTAAARGEKAGPDSAFLLYSVHMTPVKESAPLTVTAAFIAFAIRSPFIDPDRSMTIARFIGAEDDFEGASAAATDANKNVSPGAPFLSDA